MTRQDVAPHRGRRVIPQFKRCAKFIENFERKKSDLPFVIFPIIEETISPNAVAGHTLDQRHFRRRIIVRLAPMVAKKIVAGRNVKMTNLHRRKQYLKTAQMKEEHSIGSGQIIRRKQDGALEFLRDDLTVEEPLEIRVGRKTLATTMRTPGHDEELAAGFLVSEAIVRTRDQIDKFSRPSDRANRENIIVVDLAVGVKLQLNSITRFGTISSSCGLCGKNSIDAIRQNFPPIQSASDVRIEIETLLLLSDRLQNRQGDFARTGGIHAAGIFDLMGEPKIVREDIGRHNAVDKAIGRAFLDGHLPLDRHVLLVSGRASFEIMQKALAAGIPIVASVSAPSTLAMTFARESNQTLIGFLRPPSFNIYAHTERVVLS
ncbi:MAG: FdhD protein [Verrucomicrobiota bacterium]